MFHIGKIMAQIEIKQNENECLDKLKEYGEKKKSKKVGVQAEYWVIEHIIKEIFSNGNPSEFTQINCFRNKGIDIVLTQRNKNNISIEVKASNRKKDYFKENFESPDTPEYLFGNALKYKDIDLKTGLLEADFLIFAVKVREDGDSDPFDYWIFSRFDLAELYPKATLFIPSFIPTLMIKNGESHFSDDYTSFNKGVFQIILPLYLEKKWSKTYPIGEKHSFTDTWCPLIDDEYEQLSKIMNKGQESFIGKWEKIFHNDNLKEKIIQNHNYVNSFQQQKCHFFEKEPSEKRCKDCQKSISGSLPFIH